MGCDDDFGTTEIVGCMAALEKRKMELELTGRTVLATDNPLKGRVGFVGFRPKPEGMEGDWTKADEEAITVFFHPFGKELRPEGEHYASPEAMEEAVKGHSDHPGFRKHCDPVRRTIGFICYCTADAGICFLCTVSLTVCMGLSEDVRRAITPEDVLGRSDRTRGPSSGRT